MKSSFVYNWMRLVAGLLWAAAACCVDAEPTTASTRPPVKLIVGLSPFFDRSVKDDVYRRIVTMLVQDLPVGSSFTAYDAYHLTTIVHLEIPTARAFQNERTRVNQFQEPIRRLQQFLAREENPPGTSASNAPNAVRFPQFVRLLAEQPPRSNHFTAVIILGHPLYLDAKEPSFSMRDGYFPSDGHLTATRQQSVYGQLEPTNVLAGITVHFGYFGDPWISELHQERIRRFWSLYLQQQGGNMGTFSSDLTAVFRGIDPNTNPVRQPVYALDAKQTELTMLRMTRTVEQTDWITRNAMSTEAPPSPKTRIGPMKIGIRWKGNIDLDLYSRSRGDAETLSFHHPRSPDGYYDKDHRASPEHDYEFIEFEQPVDIREVEASVNYYAGDSSTPPSGEVRIEYENHIYSGNFQLAALHGNQGRGGEAQKEYWTRLDIPRILRLPMASGMADGKLESGR